MKRSKSILFILLLFAQLSLTNAREEPPEYPTQKEAQEIFDAAVLNADRAKVLVQDLRSEPIPLYELAPDEIRVLCRYVRLKIEPLKKEIVDGKETYFYPRISVDCSEFYTVELTKESKPLLTFYIFGKDCIGCKRILADTVIFVDKAAMEPFYTRLDCLMKVAIKSKSLAPKPPATTPLVK